MLRMPFTMAAGLSAVFAFSSVIPAQAMPIAPQQIERPAQAEIVQAKSKVKLRRNNRFKRHRHFNRRYSHNRRYYKGRHYHRRHYRPGFRAGFWRPAPSVVIKVRPGKRWGSRHVRWCRNNYVSYRARDNSFKPYNGPRRQCLSPYRG